MKSVACDLCGSVQAAPVHTAAGPPTPSGRQVFQVVECRGCGLLYLNPRPEGDELAAYYADPYYDTLASEADRARPWRGIGRDMRRDVRRALLHRRYGYPAATRKRLPEWAAAVGARVEGWRLRVSGREAAIVPFVGEGRLLDVGCGTGADLRRFQQEGWHVTGVEMSPYAAARARSVLGCEILVGHFDDVVIEPRRFDAVRLSHVLEHLPSPRRALEKIHRLLHPGGLFWLEVPNAGSVERGLFGRHWFQWDLPRHLYHFTPATLTRLLRETGFQPRKVSCDGRVGFFAESLADALEARIGLRRSAGKRLARLARPLVYALGAMDRGGILTVHAVRE